jgi:hypothetical protein
MKGMRMLTKSYAGSEEMSRINPEMQILRTRGLALWMPATVNGNTMKTPAKTV